MSKNSKHVLRTIKNYCNANDLHNTSWTSKVLKEKKIMNTIHDKRKGISDPLQSKGQWSSMVISSNSSMGTVRNRQGTTIADGLGLGGGITVCTPSILLPSELESRSSCWMVSICYLRRAFAAPRTRCPLFLGMGGISWLLNGCHSSAGPHW